MRETLKHFLQLDGVFKETMDYVKYLAGEQGILSNFIQGVLWKEKKTFCWETCFTSFCLFR